jgi:hypothetical protein
MDVPETESPLSDFLFFSPYRQMRNRQVFVLTVYNRSVNSNDR